MEKYVYHRMKHWIKRKHPKGGVWKEKLTAIWPKVEATFKDLRAKEKPVRKVRSNRTTES